MRLECVEVSGFFHFDAAMRLDLRDLPDGLIAVVGPNGAGKTGTVLDAPLACLFGPGVQNKAFPSRDGTLFTYATSREAYLDTTWNLDSRGRVRCRVNVDGQRRKVDAVLEEIGPDGVAHPVNSNGLVATYRDAVAERFPSLRSLLASAYAAQNRRGGFGELGQKERMELFVELADLAHYEVLSQTARQCQQVADGVAARLRAAADVLRRDATPEALVDLASRSAAVAAQIDAELVAQRHAAVLVRDTEAALASRRVEMERHAVAAARHGELLQLSAQADLAAAAHSVATARLLPASQVVLSQIELRFTDGLAAATRRRQAELRAYDAAVADRAERIANNRRLLAQAPAIQDAVTQVATIEDALVRDRGIETEQRRLIDDGREAERNARNELMMAEHAASASKVAKDRAALLTTVKFGEQCGIDPACPLVLDAVAARDAVAALDRQAAAEPELREAVAYRQQVVAARMTARDEATSRIADHETVLRRVSSLAKQAPYLDAALARIVDYEREATAADAVHQDAVCSAEAERPALERIRRQEVQTETEVLAARQAEAAAQAETLAQAATASRQRVTEAQVEVQATAGARAATDRLEATLRGARSAAVAAETAAARLTAEQQALARQRDDLMRRQGQAAEAGRRLRTVEDEGMAWQVLAKACGRDGLQRLEIDAAGPVVSDLANQLLAVGYGTRFAVQLVTQVATADGKDLKEKFTIDVLDNEHGGEVRDIGDLSGGERVVVEEGVRAAFSAYVSMRSGQPCRTIWRDETLGALDPENAPRYVAMLRKLLDLSGAQQVLFITHNPAAAALADAQVRVCDGTATVSLPPYTEVAA